MTTVVNIRNMNYDVKVCRSRDGKIWPSPHESCCGNPFHLIDVDNKEEREECIRLYYNYFHARINYDKKFKEYVLSLRNKRLGCFCFPLRCHANVIVDYIEDYYKDE